MANEDKMRPLYKTTIVIWTDWDPSDFEVDDLANQAVDGPAYCSKQETTKIEDPDSDPEFVCGKFFDE